MKFLSILILIAMTSQLNAEDNLTSIWDLKALSKPPKMEWVDSNVSIRSLIFTGPDYNGGPTQVFAFYATPGTLSGDPSKDKNLPAVVLLHGGGGTAFADWVELWAKRGYAAIALDFSGRRPASPVFDKKTNKLVVERNHGKLIRTRLPHGGPEHTGEGKFKNVGGDITDDWQYHAISNILLAHSLVRSFPEVDPERTAVTGISWGGYLTCIAASVDSRFKAAVPVYGCGFLYEGESVQKPQIDRLSPEKREEWIKMYDPSKHLVNCHVPIFFVNGTNDIHYPLDSYMKSYHAVPGEKNLRIEVNMRHGHPPGWAPMEIEQFVASKIHNAKPLAKIDRPEQHAAQATAQIQSQIPIAKAHFHWTSDQGLLSKRKWSTTAAALDDKGRVLTSQVPDDATIWYFTATDERGAMTSSEVIFVATKNN